MAEEITNTTEQATETAQTEQATETTQTDAVDTSEKDAEIARLKAEIAKAKAATDKATSEAASMKKQLRAKQSAEEAAAEEKAEQQAALEKELAELRKERAVANSSKKAFVFLQDEQAANDVAGYLYGAEDVDAALDAIGKAWTAREKALRLEYGKIPAPGAGSTDGPLLTKEQLDAMKYTERVKFATEHPDEYNKLMGR